MQSEETTELNWASFFFLIGRHKNAVLESYVIITDPDLSDLAGGLSLHWSSLLGLAWIPNFCLDAPFPVKWHTWLSESKSEMRSFKSNENIHKKEGGSYYVVSANKASSVTLQSPGNKSQRKHTTILRISNRQSIQRLI